MELTKLIMRTESSKQVEILANVTNGSILAWAHANLLGVYDFRDLRSKNNNEFTRSEVMNFKVTEGWQ